MDRLTPEERSTNMGRILGKDTKPEMRLRRYLHSRGLRYRLHARDLPGSPDIVLDLHALLFSFMGASGTGMKGAD